MRFCKSLALSLFLLISLNFITSSTHAATFSIVNNCPYKVWATARSGGGRRLEQGQTWTMSQPAGTTLGRIWARTSLQKAGMSLGQRRVKRRRFSLPLVAPSTVNFGRLRWERRRIEASVMISPSTMITISPGTIPSCLTTAGRAMIPAPMIVVERLKTGLENDAPSRATAGSR